MIKFLKKLFFALIYIIFSNPLYAKEEIIFSLDNDYYTTIDLEERKGYLNIINKKNNIDERLIFQDLISVVIFDKEFKKNKRNLNRELIQKIFDDFNKNLEISNKKKFIKHLKYDYQKKIILEEMLKKKYNSLKKNEKKFDIYNIVIKYFTLDFNNKKEYENLKNIIITKSLSEIENILKNNKYRYKYIEKKIIDVDKTDIVIKQNIKNNFTYFIRKVDNKIFLGKIIKSIKNDINILLNFYKIDTNEIIKENLIKCENIENLKKDIRVQIKQFEDLSLDQINDEIKKKLIYVNDKIKIINNERLSYILLCNIKYDDNLLKQNIFNEQIDKLIVDIEKEFIKRKKIEFNYIKNER